MNWPILYNTLLFTYSRSHRQPFTCIRKYPPPPPSWWGVAGLIGPDQYSRSYCNWEMKVIAFALQTAGPSRGTDDHVKWLSRLTDKHSIDMGEHLSILLFDEILLFHENVWFCSMALNGVMISPKIWDSNDLRPDVHQTRKAVSFYTQYSVCPRNRSTQRLFSVKYLFGEAKITWNFL